MRQGILVLIFDLSASALYMRILDNFDHFANHLEGCIDAAMNAGSFNPPSIRSDLEKLSGFQLFFALSTVLFE